MHDIIGSGITLNINIDKIGNLTMDDLSFTVRFFTVGGPYIEMYKDQLKRIDANNYIACIDTTDLKSGKLFMRAYISIPDNNYLDGYRVEIAEVDTNIYLVK